MYFLINKIFKSINTIVDLPSLEKVVIVASKPESKLKNISEIRNSCFLDDFLESGKNPDGTVPEMVFEQFPFTHPVYINYTSGTTGLPKAIVNSGAHLLSVYRDWILLSNSDRSCRWLSLSPAGWASWNFGIGMLFLGITLVLFEGFPFYLSPTFYWDMMDKFGITHCLLMPSVLDEMERRGYVPTQKHHLSSLKLVVSGGSVVKRQNFDFFYSRIKKDAVFTNVFSFTEICGAFVMMNVETLKIHSGEVTAPTLGMDVHCLDDFGKDILGDIGELVIGKTFNDLPLGIYGDTDRSIYKRTYFDKYPGKFTSGDMAIINPVTKGILPHGRSDEVLKARGCRFGSSEIYNIVNKFTEVEDSLCVSHYNSKRDERAVLFLKLKSGYRFGQHLVSKIQKAISEELSVRHVPEVVLETKAIPHNINNKKMEIIVKKIINNMPYNPETVANPESLENFKNLPELGDFV